MDPASIAVSAAAPAASSFLPTSLGGWLSAGNSAASLLGGLFGGNDSRSERESMADQMFFNLASAQHMPYATVKGLKRAGLNPMLAVSKGLNSAAPISSSPGAQDNATSQRMLAMSTASNQAAQAQMYSAQAELLKSQERTERWRPTNVAGDTDLKYAQQKAANAIEALHKQSTATESFRTGTAEMDKAFSELKYAVDYLQLPRRVKAEADKAIAEARSARTKAEVDEKLLFVERLIATGSEAVGSVTGGIGRLINSAVRGKKLKDVPKDVPSKLDPSDFVR